MSEKLESKMNDFMWKVERIQDDLQEIIDEYNNVQTEECEAAFDLYIQNGFTVGTKFKVEDNKNIWTITGINNRGYVVKTGSEKAYQKTTLEARSKEKVEVFIKKLRIVRDDESEVLHV